MTLQREYFSAKGCSSGATSGAKALMSWFLGAYPGRGVWNGGIYNCRKIDGTNTWSIHAEGRAADLGVTVGNSWSFGLAEKLRVNSKELGVQLVIHNKKVWSANQPDAGWRDYNGSNPHTDHLHVELTPGSGRALTVARVNAVMEGTNDEIEGWVTAAMATLKELREGDADRDAYKCQGLLNAWLDEAGANHIAVDGQYGPETKATVVNFQHNHGLKTDGVCGPKTWSALITR